MILRVLAVSMIGFTLAGCVSSSGLSGDVYSASEAKTGAERDLRYHRAYARRTDPERRR